MRPDGAAESGPYTGDYDMESEMDALACQWIADVCAPTEVAGIDDLRDGTPRLALLLALAGLDSYDSARICVVYLPTFQTSERT